MKYILMLSLVVVLSGCLGGGRARVYVVQEDNIPMQVIDETTIKVRVIDSVTQKEAEVDKQLTGYYILSPQLYGKLVKTAAKVVPEK